MIGMGNESWTYELYPTDAAAKEIQAVQTRVEAGQKITIAWDAVDGWRSYTNKYLWRCIGAIFDGYDTAYASVTMSQMSGQTGQTTYTVTTAGNILFGGYSNGLNQNNFIGKFIKIKIENSQE